MPQLQIKNPIFMNPLSALFQGWPVSGILLLIETLSCKKEVLLSFQVWRNKVSDVFNFCLLKLLQRGTFILLFLLTSVWVLATPISTTATGGNWSAATTWTGGIVPGNGDAVTIIGGATVTVDVNTAACASLKLNSTGANKTAILQFINTGVGVLTVGGNVTLGGTSSGNFSTRNNLLMSNAGTLICNGFSLAAVAGSNTFTPGAGTVQLAATNILPATIFTAFNNLQIKAGTTTLARNLTINGTLTVASGATFATATAFTLGVTGATSVTGTLTLAGTGNTTFTGNVIINSGGTWNETTASAITNAGNLQNDGTFTANTGIHTFSGAAKTIGGAHAIIIPSVTVSGSPVNNGTLTVGTALAGGGRLTNSATGFLNLGGTVTITTLTATAVGNIVNYTGSGQTLKVTAYHHLNLTGGAETFGAITTVAGNLTLKGTATATTAANLTIGGNFSIGNGTGFTAAGFALTVTGTTTVGGGTSGTLNINNATGTKTFTGDVTTNAGAIWNETAAAAIRFAGNLINNAATFTSSPGVHTFSGTAKTCGGSTATSIANLTVSGTCTINGSLTVGTALIIAPVTASLATASTFILTVTGTTSVSGTVTLAGTSTKIFTGNVTVNAGGTWNETGVAAISYGGNLVNNGSFTANTGIHTFSGTTKTISGINVIAIPNLTISGTTKNNGTLTVATNFAGTSTLTNGASGVLNLGGTSAITTLNATTVGNTVNYKGTGQTLKVTAYHHLILSGGAETFGAITTIVGNLTLSGTASATTGANLTIGGNLNTSNGTSLTTASTFTLGITGTTSVTGTLTLTGTGTSTFSGNVIINAGGSWNETGVAAISYGGNLLNNGSYTTNTGIHTFTGTTKTISGANAIAIANLTISGTTTNNGTLTVATNLAGASALTNGATGVLNLGGTSTITILTATAVGNIVNYTGAAQTVHSNNYYNLTMSGSGVKTLQAGTTAITGNLILSGTTSTKTVVGLTITGNLIIGNGTGFTAAGFALTVTGTTTIGGATSGNLTVSSVTGAKLFTGLVTIATGATWTNSIGSAIQFRRGITNSGTFTAGAGLYYFTTNAQALTGTFSIPNVTVAAIALTNNNTLTVATALAGTGGLTQAGNAVLNIGGTSAINALTATANPNAVNYTGAAQTVKAVAYNNLSFSGSGAKSIATGTSIAGNLSISAATASIGAGLNISTFNLTLGGTNKAAGTWGSTTSTATHKDNTYFAATTGILTVTNDSRPVPTFTNLTATPTITYGTATVTLSGKVSGAGPVYPVNGETVSVTIKGTTQNAVISGGAGAFSINFPTAAIPVTGGPYTITYAYSGGTTLPAALNNTSTSLTVNTAALTITATNVNKIYGAILTGGSGSTAYTITGLQNGETAGTVTITYGTGAAAADAAGTYTGTVTPLAATGGTITSANYSISYIHGNITVAKAALTITAKNQSKSYGSTFTFAGTEFISTGLLNSDVVSSVTLTSSGAVASAPLSGSPYSIVPSAATGTGISNYTITYTNGVLTINSTSEGIADFRSKASGNFSDITKWEYDQGGNTWTNATLLPASTNNITILSGNIITLNQNFTEGAGKTLLINSGGSLVINELITLDVAATGTLNFNGQLVTVKSTAIGTGAIGKILGTLSNATNVTVERFITTPSRAWRLLTIPATTAGKTIRDAWAGGIAPNPNAPSGEVAGNGTLITGPNYTSGTTAAAAGFDFFNGLGSGTSSSIRFYTSAKGWRTINTPIITTAPTEQGYMMYVRGDRTVAATGGIGGTTTLRPNGTIKSGLIQVPVPSAAPFTVVGNPYAASIDLDAVYSNSGNSNVINRTFYIWDATQGTISGAYRTLIWDGVSAYTMTGGISGIASDYLVVNSGQAIIVAGKNGGGTLTINESNKTSLTPKTLFRPMGATGSVVSNLSVKLYEATGSIIARQMDGAVARFNNMYNVSPNEMYDAAKLNNFNENISLVRNNRYLSVESRPFPIERDTLFVPFWNLKIRDYALSITSNNFAGINQTAILTDRFTNTQKVVNLSDTTTMYPFTITGDPASSSLNRFIIVMAPSAPLAVSVTKINVALIGNKVLVSWNSGSEAGIKNYEVEKSADGIVFSGLKNMAASNAATGTSYQLMDEQPFKGNNFYRIRSNNESGKITFSGIALVQLSGKKGIQVTPTVITNQHFMVSLTDQPAGNYSLLLTSSTGQQVYQKVFKYSGGNNTLEIQLGKASMAAGIYNLSVSDGNGNKHHFRLFIN